MVCLYYAFKHVLILRPPRVLFKEDDTLYILLFCLITDVFCCEVRWDFLMWQDGKWHFSVKVQVTLSRFAWIYLFLGFVSHVCYTFSSFGCVVLRVLFLSKNWLVNWSRSNIWLFLDRYHVCSNAIHFHFLDLRTDDQAFS